MSYPLTARLLLSVLIFLVTQTACYRQQRKADVIYLPEDFIGNVMIIFGQTDGAAAISQRGARLFLIPKNGILRTQHHHIRPDSIPKFMESGTNRRLNYDGDRPLQKIKKNESYCCNWRPGSGGDKKIIFVNSGYFR
jgi:hypothetical protein